MAIDTVGNFVAEKMFGLKAPQCGQDSKSKDKNVADCGCEKRYIAGDRNLFELK